MMTDFRAIEVLPYDPSWPIQFEEQQKLISSVLGSNACAIYHVGSTSVPGLAAKPKIDILAVVKNPQQAIQQLAQAHFVYKGEWNIPFHYGFSKRGEVDVNLHVYEENHPEIELNLSFRDYLRLNEGACKEYELLKYELLEKPTSFIKQNSMFSGYNLGKDDFIRGILIKLGFDRVRFLKCTHFSEWESVRQLQKNQGFCSSSENCINDKDNQFFVLLEGVDTVAYAHVRLYPDYTAEINTIGFKDEAIRHTFEHTFVRLLKKWIENRSQTHVD